MGGRGARSSSGYDGRGGGGGLSSADIISTTSLISERERKQRLVDQTLSVFKDVNDEYGYVVGDIQIAKLKPKAANVMAYYDGDNIAVNESYFDGAKMEMAYDRCVKQGFHPSKGSKTAMQAVASHELGHALTDSVADKMGIKGVDKTDKAATRIVTEARKQTKSRGVVQMASKISKYATHSNSEAVAEAFADVYCNGKKAKNESKAIVNVVNSYLK